MTFAIKGGRGRVFNFCLKTIQNHSLAAKKRFVYSLSVAEYDSQRSQQPEPIRRGLKSDIF